VLTEEFNYLIPPELVAQFPAPRRDQSRLLVLNRGNRTIDHRNFADFPQFLRTGDVLVLNDSKVFPARLWGQKPPASGRLEVLLLEEVARNDWWAMIRPGKRVREGTVIEFTNRRGDADTNAQATVIEKSPEGRYRLKFGGPDNIVQDLERLGDIPLPPYIKRESGRSTADDRERYQTVYARSSGSVAAPTAGLHFSERLLDDLRFHGVEVRFLTLHVGAATFAPVKCERLEDHPMHSERFAVGAATASAINEAKKDGRRVIAVGTTVVRVLEHVASIHPGKLVAGEGRTRLFIHPPRDFRVVDALLTNFHLPCSTLLMLVGAFASPGNREGRDLILEAYAEAIREKYRFYSFGDAMLIT
jgi:S-adenosylmethionine:tRNA ribosyltransferase-isomerase